MTRRTLRFAVAVLALAAATTSAAPPPPKPNILIILADDLGYSDLGCYGSEIATPNLDSLAQSGLRFTQFYNTGRCWPSRAALLTGYYPQAVGRDIIPGMAGGGGKGGRPEWAPLLPAMLKPLGYHSYHSGKWHIDGKPLENGFEHSYEIGGHQSNFFLASEVTEDGRKLPDQDGFYITTGVADHAVRCLREHAEKYADTPFFEYLAFTSPHFPLHALPEDIARYRDRYLAGWDSLRQERFARMKEMGLASGTAPEIQRDVEPPYKFPGTLEKLGPGEVMRALPWSELTAEQQRFQATKMAIHAAMIDRMDQEIGKVFAQIRAMGAWENTLIFFASDNGASAEIMVRGGGHDPQAPPGSAATYLCLGPGFAGAANTPLRRYKTWVHEGGISTPMIAHWPAGIAARGELRSTPAHLIDIVPTVLALAGGSAPTEIAGKPVPAPPGRSLQTVFAADGDALHRDLWFCHDGHRGIRAGDWKAVALKGGDWELYNLAVDRAEANNLAEQHPEKLKALTELWQQHTAEMTALRGEATASAKPKRPKAKPEPAKP